MILPSFNFGCVIFWWSFLRYFYHGKSQITTMLGESFLFPGIFCKANSTFIKVKMVATVAMAVVMRRLEEMSETDGTRQRDRWRDPLAKRKKLPSGKKKTSHLWLKNLMWLFFSLPMFIPNKWEKKWCDFEVHRGSFYGQWQGLYSWND